MKKIVILITIILTSFLLVSCEDQETGIFGSMGTVIAVKVNESDKEIIKEIQDIFDLYSQISSSHNRNEVFEDSPYYDYENVYTINLNAGIMAVEVVDELIELIEYGLLLNEQTNGYFNIGIGHLVDLWKEPIMTHLVYSEHNYDRLLEEALALEEVDLQKIIINKENKTVYLQDDSIKLDLGALSKGYALNKAVELLKEKGITHYSINAGNSSLAFGARKFNKPFYVGLKDYCKVYEEDYIGMVKAVNMTMSTTNSSEQNVVVVGENGRVPEKLIHHIVSPFSKKPENFYKSISLVGPNAGLLDAYTTAIYLMNPDEVLEFLDSLEGIGYVLYNLDYSVQTNMSKDTFKRSKLKRNK